MITKQEKQTLKTLGHSLRPVYQIGKSGITNDMVTGINEVLENRELIKISILQNCPVDKKEIAFDLVRLTQSELIQLVGRTIVIYRKSQKNKNNII